MDTDFVTWLTDEMKKRDWSISELARRSHVSHAAVSNVLSGNRNPGPDLCTAIAHAFRLPPEDIFRKAGLLPKGMPPDDPDLDEISRAFKVLSPEKRKHLLSYARYLRDQSSEGKETKSRL